MPTDSLQFAPPMLSISDALHLILDRTASLAPITVQLADALGCVLSSSIASDIDSPPYDKSIVDGYALRATDAALERKILEEVTAGASPTKHVEPGTATRIMTGAPLPTGADAVVMVEHTETTGDRVRILPSPNKPTQSIKPGQNIMRRAAALQQGQVVLETGKLLRPMEIGLLAEVGSAQVPVIPRPSVAVLATGNELVSASNQPKAFQIRNSNSPMLAALAQEAGAIPRDLGIARDDRVSLEASITAGLACDLLLISGGVSAGVLDLVPAILASLGVEQVFHKVNLKPGKPLWFGTRPREAGGQTLVFGLPGNPVSSLVCFELFVLPAIQRRRGLAHTGLPRSHARLTASHQQRGDRPTYWPAQFDAAKKNVTPLSWKGSADLCTLTQANCLAVFTAGDRQYSVGDEIEVLALSSDF